MTGTPEAGITFPTRNTIWRPAALGTYAIIAYLLFLAVPVRPDPSTLLLLAFGLMAFLSPDGSRPDLRRTDYMALSIFITAACFATAFSEDLARSSRYLVYLFTNVFLLLLAASIKDVRQVYAILVCLAFLGLAHLLAILVASVATESATPEMIIGTWPLATMLVPNDAMIIGLCLPALVVLTRRISGRWSITTLLPIAVYVLLGFYASYLLQSKVAFIGLVTALLAICAGWLGYSNRRAHLKRSILISWMLTFALVTLLLTAWQLGNQSTTRLGLWSYAVMKTSGAGMLIGSGPNTFSYDPGTVETAFEEGDMIIPWVHNVFLESYTEQGLLGLIAILALCFAPLVRAIRLDDPPMRALILASSTSFILLSMIEITLTRRFCFAFLALLYGLSCSPALRRPP